MTEKAFREKMFKVKTIIYTEECYCCEALCLMLGRYFSELFSNIFSNEDSYYFELYGFGFYGPSHWEDSKLMRIDALSFFEEYCVSEKLYKEW